MTPLEVEEVIEMSVKAAMRAHKAVQDLYVQLKMPPLKDYDNLRRPDCLKFGGEIRAAKAQ